MIDQFMMVRYMVSIVNTYRSVDKIYHGWFSIKLGLNETDIINADKRKIRILRKELNNEFSKFERKISINEECIEDWNKRMDDETSSESNQTKFRIEQFQEDNKSLNNEIEHIKPKLAMLNHVLRLKTVIEDIEKYSRIKFNDKVIRNQINNFNAEVKREEKNIGSLLSRFDRTITKLGHWQGD